MSSILQSFQMSKQALPVSQIPAAAADSSSKDQQQSLRRRLSSFSLKFQPISSPAAAATSWAAGFRRSKSVSSMSDYAGTTGSSTIRKWWDWGWAWILSRKPTLARDLEMNEEETLILGSHNKGTWKHVLYKVRSELRRFVGSDEICLPQTIRYDDGKRTQA